MSVALRAVNNNNPAERPIEERVPNALSYANSLVVDSNDRVEAARTAVLTIRDMKRVVDGLYDSIIERQRGALEETRGKKNALIVPLKRAEDVLKSKIARFFDDIQRAERQKQQQLAESRRREQQALLENIAGESASIEQRVTTLKAALEAAEAQWETSMADEERDALGEKISRLAEEYQKASQEFQMRRIAATNVATPAAETVSVAVPPRDVAIAQPAASVALPPQAAPAPAVKGVSVKETRVPEVVDKMSLVKAVAAGQVPLRVLDVNMAALKEYVNNNMVLPGVAVSVVGNVRVASR